MKTKIAILGAGPAGLTVANALLKRGIRDFLVLEKESKVGGLCRSTIVDDSPFDISGGHFLDTRNAVVNNFLFSFLPCEEWNQFTRDSKISLFGRFISSPLEANIWQLDKPEQERYLHDISVAGCNTHTPKPEKFIDWIYWKLGAAIANDYMIPYNKKMFGDDLNQLGTYWLNKLPNVSYADTLHSCQVGKAMGSQPAHAKFLYPKRFGYGELWLRMGKAIENCLIRDYEVCALDISSRTINDDICADIIINTIPLPSIKTIDGLPSDLASDMACLKHTSIDVEYVPTTVDTTAHWIYIPNESAPEHRWLVRGNFIKGAKGYWKETRLQRSHPEPRATHFISNYAYPLNTIGKNEYMARLTDVLKAHRIYLLGRWGEWQHYNSDVVVEHALNLSAKLAMSI